MFYNKQLFKISYLFLFTTTIVKNRANARSKVNDVPVFIFTTSSVCHLSSNRVISHNKNHLHPNTGSVMGCFNLNRPIEFASLPYNNHPIKLATRPVIRFSHTRSQVLRLPKSKHVVFTIVLWLNRQRAKARQHCACVWYMFINEKRLQLRHHKPTGQQTTQTIWYSPNKKKHTLHGMSHRLTSFIYALSRLSLGYWLWLLQLLLLAYILYATLTSRRPLDWIAPTTVQHRRWSRIAVDGFKLLHKNEH